MGSSKMRFVLLLVSTMFLISVMACPQAAASNTAYIDEHNRFILNEDPFFPIGLYVAQCSTVDQSVQLGEIENSPFDTLMNYNINSCSGIDATPAQIAAYLDQLDLRNLKLIYSLEEYIPYDPDNQQDPCGDIDINSVQDKVQTFKDHPAVISWYLNDEVGSSDDPVVAQTDCVAQLLAGYEEVTSVDGNHPVWSVHWDTSFWDPDYPLNEAHTTDIVGVDPYPIAHLPITNVSGKADEANAAGKPLWLVPQIFSWTDYPGDFRAATGRPPTREEMRAMTYLATNHGAKGLIYYSYFDIRNDGDFWDRWPQIKGIASEIDQLRSVFLSIDQTNVNDIVCDNADIDFKLMREGNTYYLFAVNTKEGSTAGVSFQINLAKKPAVFDTLFEHGRQISVVKGKVTDDFDVYEVHVYYWEKPESDDGGGGSSGGCFIATAAFGSYVDPHVQVIRDFRDEYLLTNMPGRWFVSMYNTYGPFWADLLNAHPRSKPFVRLALMPVVCVSYFVLNTSLATKLLTGFLLMGFVVICVLRVHGRSARRGLDFVI